MKKQSGLNWLVPLIAVLVLVTTLTGLLWQSGSGPYTFTNQHGQEVEMDGRGLYRNDSLFSAAAFRGTDVVSLTVVVPLMLLSFRAYRRGSLRGGLVLTGALSYFVYNGASMAFAASFNSLFLVYSALFSASTFAFILAMTMFDLRALRERVLPQMPHRGVAIFMFVAGIGTLFIWLSDVIGPLLSGTAPALLGPYTTYFTHSFDSALITPAAVLAGVYMLRREPLGYLLSLPLMVLCTLIGIVVLAQTAAQYLAGIIFPIPVYIGMVGSWIVMGAFAIWLSVRFLNSIAEKPVKVSTKAVKARNS
jgi:hypothetical protein